MALRSGWDVVVYSVQNRDIPSLSLLLLNSQNPPPRLAHSAFNKTNNTIPRTKVSSPSHRRQELPGPIEINKPERAAVCVDYIRSSVAVFNVQLDTFQ
jgi:hypothetical protein